MAHQHPGEILLDQYLKPQKLSQNQLARSILVPPRRINEIILGKRAISADTAVRLGYYFSNSAGYWLRLQTEYDIELAREKIGSRLYTIQVNSGTNLQKPIRNETRTPPNKPSSKPAIRKRLMR